MNDRFSRLTASVALASLVLALGTAMIEPALGATDRAAPRVDAWTPEERAILATMTIDKLPVRPRDPSNAVELRPEAGALGKRVFADTRFSADGKVACATCHVADQQFQDGLPVGRGVGTGSRRTMPIAATGHGPWLFWDGRKDSVWAQALGPLEDAVEHGGNRTQYAHLVRANYRAEYETLFGPLPALEGLPQHAGPLGTDAERRAWNTMSEAARDDVSRIFANLGKAIAAYEGTLAHGDARFDRYVRATLGGDLAAQQDFTPREVNGLRIFIGKGQCATCHNGPLLTDQAFHNTGVPQRDAQRADRGRAAAIAKVVGDEFNCLGRFSDARPEQCGELRFIADDDPALEGAFKTPSLRNVAQRAPYMHAGQLGTLEDVVGHYVRSPKASVGHSELAHRGPGGHADRVPIRLSATEQADLVQFLRTLSGPVGDTTQR